MIILYVILGISLGFLFLILLSHFLTQQERKQKTKDWKVGDKIILSSHSESKSLRDHMEKTNKSFANLLGWSHESVYLGCESTVYKLPWKCVDSNKSALWRKNHNDCRKFMGKEPGFDSGVREEGLSNSTSLSIDGHLIETMNETLCKIYLEQAIKEEKYEIAEAIRKRLENFR